MSKTIQVIKPFFTMSAGDILELAENGKDYVYAHGEEFNKNTESGEDFRSSFNSSVILSTPYVKELIKQGFLQEVVNDKQNFVNVFTEIDNLLNKYNVELLNIDADTADEPMCVKIEKATVLQNMIKVLNHLKSLKK